ncbi:hypothetical protein, conserved [Babesia bigemina]|uniref:Uncharacterized protein n=1 Tax=Babesia bigemina TaxID=5866 RepID=A0A061DD84_BABBI|nr:hypothetical protein, conserved [Babesia bigemina]CDR96045.1 hypothetical protein, conserved [Babesia bigemina]|eukprot:XP_012768231.1 hypothetical protein, conserved [Babesia bigemina]
MEADAAVSPPSIEIDDGTSCLICYEDLILSNAVAYKATEDAEWALSTFCIDCIKQLLATQYERYITSLRTTNCAKEQRALLERGPPVNISDHLGFPLAEKREVYALYDMGQQAPLSAKLEGSVTGEERERLWEELSKFKFKGDHEE